MYRSLGAVAAAAMLAAIAIPGPTAAAEQRGLGIHKQASGEEFSAQRRRYVRRYYAPRRYAYRRYGPRFYRPYAYRPYGYPYYPYVYPYRGYYAPGPFVSVGPFGFGFGFGGW